MSWTPEREEKLRELWKKGHTASKIAELIGDTTRNAIIGKAHRLNLQARAESKKSLPRANNKHHHLAIVIIINQKSKKSPRMGS